MSLASLKLCISNPKVTSNAIGELLHIPFDGLEPHKTLRHAVLKGELGGIAFWDFTRVPFDLENMSHIQWSMVLSLECIGTWHGIRTALVIMLAEELNRMHGGIYFSYFSGESPLFLLENGRFTFDKRQEFHLANLALPARVNSPALLPDA
jgi:hypothetical protein